MSTIQESLPYVGSPQQHLWRLPGVFFRPAATFEAVNLDPNWLLPLAAAALLRTARAYAVYQPSRNPLAVFLTYLLEGVLPVLLPVIICTGALLLCTYALKGRASFKGVFSLLSHTFFAYTTVSIVLGVTVLLLAPDAAQLDRQNPVVSHLGFLVSSRESLPLNHLLSSIDAFVFYHLFLIGLGLSRVARGLSFRRALLAAALPWGLYVAVTVGIKALVA